jgi:hypothetical protein
MMSRADLIREESCVRVFCGELSGLALAGKAGSWYSSSRGSWLDFDLFDLSVILLV